MSNHIHNRKTTIGLGIAGHCAFVCECGAQLKIVNGRKSEGWIIRNPESTRGGWKIATD